MVRPQIKLDSTILQIVHAQDEYIHTNRTKSPVTISHWKVQDTAVKDFASMVSCGFLPKNLQLS